LGRVCLNEPFYLFKKLVEMGRIEQKGYKFEPVTTIPTNFDLHRETV